MNRKVKLIDKSDTKNKITGMLLSIVGDHYIVAKGKELVWYHKNQWAVFLVESKKVK